MTKIKSNEQATVRSTEATVVTVASTDVAEGFIASAKIGARLTGKTLENVRTAMATFESDGVRAARNLTVTRIVLVASDPESLAGINKGTLSTLRLAAEVLVAAGITDTTDPRVMAAFTASKSRTAVVRDALASVPRTKAGAPTAAGRKTLADMLSAVAEDGIAKALPKEREQSAGGTEETDAKREQAEASISSAWDVADKAAEALLSVWADLTADEREAMSLRLSALAEV